MGLLLTKDPSLSHTCSYKIFPCRLLQAAVQKFWAVDKVRIGRLRWGLRMVLWTRLARVEAGNILGTLQDKLQTECPTHRVVPVVREVGDIGEVLYNCRGERTWTIAT